jgi:hypothetical protein
MLSCGSTEAIVSSHCLDRKICDGSGIEFPSTSDTRGKFILMVWFVFLENTDFRSSSIAQGQTTVN